MFEKKIRIQDNSLVVGKRKIQWSQIVGLRQQKNPLLQKVSGRFPRAEIFLKGGQVVTISSLDKFDNRSSYLIDNEKNPYNSVISIIRNNSTSLNPVFERWVEWRLILPIVAGELIAVALGVILGMTLERIVFILIAAGILGSIVGWVWERKIRIAASRR